MTIEYYGPVNIYIPPEASFLEEEAKIVKGGRPYARVLPLLPPGFFYDITPEDIRTTEVHILRVNDDLTGTLHTKEQGTPTTAIKLDATNNQKVISRVDGIGMSIRGVIYYRKD